MVVAVLTCSPDLRGGADFLPATLASLDAAGAGRFRRLVFHDGPLLQQPNPLRLEPMCRPDRFGRWPVQALPERLGNRAAREVLFRELAALGEDALVLEDDVIACAHAVDAAAELVVDPRCAVASLFHATLATGHYGFAAFPFLWSQAVVWPLRTLLWVAEHGFGPADPDLSDEAMAGLAAGPWREYEVRSDPCWFEHAGARASSIFPTRPAFTDRPKRYRLARQFNPSYDARDAVRAPG